MANAATKAHQLLCSLNLHLWGRARRQMGVAGRSRTCLSCGQKLQLPVSTKADASHAAKVATSGEPRARSNLYGLRTVKATAGPPRQRPPLVIRDEDIDPPGPPAHLPLTPEGEAAEMKRPKVADLNHLPPGSYPAKT